MLKLFIAFVLHSAAVVLGWLWCARAHRISGGLLSLACCLPAEVLANTQPVAQVLQQADSAPLSPQFLRLEKARFSDHPFSHINAIAQGPKGFLWVGTANGLLRYDGTETKLYRNDSANPLTLSTNYVRKIHFDHNQVMWIASEYGLNEYNAEADSFIRWIHDPDNPETIGNNFVKWVSSTRANELLVGTGRGFDIISADRKSIRHFQADTTVDLEPGGGLSHNYVSSILEDSLGNLWIGTEGGGLNYFNRKNETYLRYSSELAPPLTISGDHITRLLEDRKGRVWVSTLGNGLSRIEKNGEVVHYPVRCKLANCLPDNIIYDMFEDSRGRLWILTDRAGVVFYNEATNSFSSISHNPYDPMTLMSSTTRSITEDSYGNIWVGTFPLGLNFLSQRAALFHFDYHVENNPGSLSNSAILSVTRDSNDNLWVGTEAGLNRQTNNASRFEHLVKGDTPYHLPADAVLAIQEDIDGQLWLGTWGGGLARYNPKTGIIKRYGNTGEAGALASDFVWRIFLDSRRRIWVGTETAGVFLYDRTSDTFTNFKYDPADDSSLSYDYVWDILEDSNKRIWVGSQYGLNLFYENTAKFKRYLPKAKEKDGFSVGRIQDMLQGPGGRIWIATQGGGLNIFTPETETFQHIGVANGLADDGVSALEMDSAGRIWAATADGLSVVDAASGKVLKSFNDRNGVMADQFIRRASHKDSDGKLYFGSSKGLLSFYPDAVLSDSPLPNPIITDIQVLNQSLSSHVIDYPLFQKKQRKPLVLRHDQNIISFGFTATNFQQRLAEAFAYRLVNFDNDWQKIINRKHITYTNLNAGRYSFELATLDGSGNLSEQKAIFSFRILPSLWRTWWAYGCYLALLVLFMIAVSRLIILNLTTRRLNQLVQTRTRELSKANEAKTDFLANMSHELRTPLNAVIGFSKRLLVKYPDVKPEILLSSLESIHRNGSHLLAIINDMLDISKIESGKMTLFITDCEIPKVIEQIRNDFAVKAEEAGLDLVVSSQCPIQQIQADSVRLNQILNNLVSNAIKYTREGNIYIAVSATEKNGIRYCRFSVEDTGVGIKKEDQNKLFSRFEQFDDETRKQRGFGTGLGLALVQSLCKAHGGWIEVVSEFGKGSEFSAVLPVQKNTSQAQSQPNL